MQTWDVIIAGGGSAGLAAALTAARIGARTLLIERQSKLGGMGTNALVHTFCGLYHPDTSRPWAWLNPGVPQEIGEHMMERTQQSAPDLMGRVYVLRQHPSLFANIADELCDAEANLTRLSGAEWCGLQQHEGGWHVDVISFGVKQTHQAKALIDTTGDATGARWLSRDLWVQAESARLYRPAYVCGLPRVTGTHDESWRFALGALIVRGIREKALPESAIGAAFRDSPFAEEMFMTIDLEAGQAQWDPFDPAKRAEVESTGRRTAMHLWTYLRERHRDFKDCPPPVLPAQAGIRESARYIGDFTLTGESLSTCQRYEDDVALAGWPMEMRENARGPKFRFFDRPEPAGIPAGCLKNASTPGLYFAGRCLSADHEALASVRVMGACMATGQAAALMALKFAS
ncbi:MAG: FAD-dependent oxidoreductase [Prosthecobacter sp.]